MLIALLKWIRNWVLLIVGIVIFFTVIAKVADWKNARTRERIAAEEARRNDPSVPPELSPIQRDRSWTIRRWLVGDGMPVDCKQAHDFMDSKTYSITRRSSKVTILDYLHSCKTARKRAEEMALPQVTKWCLYRSTNDRLEELCSEWERHGDEYLSQLDSAYASTMARFQTMTNGYYDLQMDDGWVKREGRGL